MLLKLGMSSFLYTLWRPIPQHLGLAWPGLVWHELPAGLALQCRQEPSQPCPASSGNWPFQWRGRIGSLPVQPLSGWAPCAAACIGALALRKDRGAVLSPLNGPVNLGGRGIGIFFFLMFSIYSWARGNPLEMKKGEYGFRQLLGISLWPYSKGTGPPQDILVPEANEKLALPNWKSSLIIFNGANITVTSAATEWVGDWGGIGGKVKLLAPGIYCLVWLLYTVW